MLDELRRQRDIISLEAVSGEAAHKQALSRLGAYLKGVMHSIHMHTLAPLKKIFAKRDVAAEGRLIAKIPYNEIRHLPVVGLRGQRVDFLTIAKNLSRCAVLFNTLERDVLMPFSSWLANRLANPSSLAALTGGIVIPGYKPHDLKGLNEEFVSFFDPEESQPTRKIPYGMAFRRNADWEPLADEMGTLEQALVINEQHKRMRGLVDSINELLDKLITRIEEDSEEYKVSAPTLQSLAEVTYTIAKEMEFYSMITHRTVALSEAVRETQQACEAFRKTYKA